ncbi:MAG: cupredoxin domain-containing protein [Pyrinomonadaceae bacterium]|nr:cupredoxin domain-containing protein [Pyrinomonadaceae bacterium]
MKKLKLSLALMALVACLGGAVALVTNVVEAHTRTVKIRVDKDGFSPASIDVEAGHKLNLVFNRTDENNCGNVVVFPKLKIRRNLPVGKDVIVSLTPKEAGNITFTCGMGMYKGSLVVAD